VVSSTVVISWAAPVDGGSPITGYLVEILNSDGSTYGTEITNCDGSLAAIVASASCAVPIAALR
jgi:hypothetical protein